MFDNTRLVALVGTAVALSSCGGGEVERRADTVRSDTQTEAPPAAAAAPAKLGRLPLLAAASPAGKCDLRDVPASASGASGIVQNIFYNSEFPTRTVRLALGDTSRAYRPITIDISAQQPSGTGFDDVETIWVLFNPGGDVRSGTREYKASDNSAVEKSGLLGQDTSEVKQLIQSLIATCGRPIQ